MPSVYRIRCLCPDFPFDFHSKVLRASLLCKYYSVLFCWFSVVHCVAWPQGGNGDGGGAATYANGTASTADGQGAQSRKRSRSRSRERRRSRSRSRSRSRDRDRARRSRSGSRDRWVLTWGVGSLCSVCSHPRSRHIGCMPVAIGAYKRTEGPLIVSYS